MRDGRASRHSILQTSSFSLLRSHPILARTLSGYSGRCPMLASRSFQSRIARFCLLAVSCTPLAIPLSLSAQTPADAAAQPMTAEQVEKVYADLAASRRALPRDRF